MKLQSQITKHHLDNFFISHLKHFLLLESLSLLPSLPGLLDLHTTGIGLKRDGDYLMDQTDKYVYSRHVRPVELEILSQYFKNIHRSIITVTTEI